MPYEENLIALLCKIEHIGTALEIAKVMPEVRRRLQSLFWKALRESVSSNLKAISLSEKWESVTSYDGADPIRKHSGVECRPAGASSRSRKIHVVLYVESSRLFVGVKFINERPQQLPLEVSSLINILQQDGYKEGAPWLAWKWVGDGATDNMNDNGFLLEVASDPKLAAEKAIEPLLDLLRDRGSQIGKANNPF